MDRLLLYLLLSVLILGFLLFFPITLVTDAHYDMNRKKFGFAIYIYNSIKVIGGYVATYNGGLAVHITPKKAILLPYSKLNSQRKRFSFMKTFRLITLRITTETGAEYLLPVTTAHTFLRAYFLSKGRARENIENNLWLTDGDILRISLHSVVFFNGYILIVSFVKFLKEKMSILWQKKKKRSII